MPTKRRSAEPGEDAKAILNRIRQLVRALRTFDKQTQARYGFGAAQMFILHILGQEDDLSLGELAERTATDQSSASLAVGKLVAEGYVQRTTRAEDRRQLRLTLTPKARALVKRSPPAAQERMMASVGEMSPAERTKLIALLDKLTAGMMPAGDGPAPMFFQDEDAAPKKRRRTQVHRQATSRSQRS